MSITLTDAEKQEYLGIATAIADRIVDSADRDGAGCSWPVPRRDSRTAPLRLEAGPGTLYHGSSGMALFLSRLARLTAEDRHLKTAHAALAHALELEGSRPGTGGYYSGTAGVAAVCAEMAEHTGEGRWLDEARRLCRGLSVDPASPGKLDLIGGEAGSILGLLRVYEAAGGADEEILRIATGLAEILIAECRLEPEGVSWDTMYPCVLRNLLGLSHGAGGIGLAFLELHRFVGDERYLAYAVESVRYEDSFIDPEHGYWPDLRHKPLAEYLEEGRLDDLRRDAAAGTFLAAEARPGGMAAWCHGAPGIGLVRGRFLELLGRERDRDATRRAAEITHDSVESWQPGNHSLCHGLLGNVEILLDLARCLGEEERFAPPALAVVRRAVADVTRRGGAWLSGYLSGAYTPGLMVGEVGIGHFFLRLVAPETPSVLLPVGSPDALRLRRSAGPARKHLPRPYSLHFSATRRLLAAAQANGNGMVPETIEDARRALEKQIGTLEEPVSARASRSLALESLTFELMAEQESPAEAYVASLMRRPAELLDDPATLIQLAPTARLFDTDPSFLLYRRGPAYVTMELEPLAAEIYSLLDGPMSMSAIVDRMAVRLGLTADLADSDAEAAFRDKLRSILRRAYEARILDIVEPFEIEPAEIDGELCTRCGECCRIKFQILGSVTYLDFVEEMLGKPLAPHYPEMKISVEESDGQSYVVLDLGYCRHLRRTTADGEARFHCGIYAERPETCREFNCAAWWRRQRSVLTARSASDRLIEKVAALAGKSSLIPASAAPDRERQAG